jgi:hypothetical protein
MFSFQLLNNKLVVVYIEYISHIDLIQKQISQPLWIEMIVRWILGAEYCTTMLHNNMRRNDQITPYNFHMIFSSYCTVKQEKTDL